jgi:hypothetical protein
MIDVHDIGTLFTSNRELLQKQLARAGDHREQVVEVVGDAAG